MLFDSSVLAMVVIRFFVRLRSKKPDEARIGNQLLDLAARLVHYALYITLAAVTWIGVLLSIQADEFENVFLGTGPIPHAHEAAESASLSLYSLHGFTARILLLLVIIHVGAAAYHQFIKKDRLLSRMWFGSKPETRD